MESSHDNSHSLVSDFADLILYQETVQTEFNLDMTVLAKTLFSVASSEAVQMFKTQASQTQFKTQLSEYYSVALFF